MKHHNWTVLITHEFQKETKDQIIKCEKYFDAIDIFLDKIGEEAHHCGHSDDWCKKMITDVVTNWSVDLGSGKKIDLLKVKIKETKKISLSKSCQ